MSINHNYHGMGARPKSTNPNYNPREDDEGYRTVSKRQKKMDSLKSQGAHHKSLKGAPKPDVLFLYITNCDLDTEDDEIEIHILDNFPNVTDVKAHKTRMTHNYYSSFTVTIKGTDIVTDEFLSSPSFPKPIKVFLNRNKYKEAEKNCV